MTSVAEKFVVTQMAVAIVMCSLGVAYIYYWALPADPMLMSKPNLGVIWGWAVGVGTLMVLHRGGMWGSCERAASGGGEA